MSEPITVSAGNIDKIICDINKKMDKVDVPRPEFIMIPKYWNSGKINRKIYKGAGRPRKTDYIMVHYKKYFKDLKLDIIL